MKKLLKISLVTFLINTCVAHAHPFIQTKGNAHIYQDGKTLCEHEAPTAISCFPIMNDGADDLAAHFNGQNKTLPIPAHTWLIIGWTQKTLDILPVSIENAKSQTQVFTGNAQNKIGLDCHEASCKNWS